jgi:arylsulfatase A-like enzyme
MGVTRRQFLFQLAATAVVTRFALADEKPSRRPNILLIVADDLGYGELGVQGCRDVPTPHVDSLAKHGVRFTNGYVTCPVCSPTRAALLTGRYQQRFGHEHNPGPATAANSNFGVPRTETMMSERFKKLGYATGMVGKWHLGFKPELTPPQRGFDEFFGFLGGAHPYLPAGRRTAAILRGTETVEEKEYLTDAFAREAVAFIEKHKAEPFFLYLPFNAVHAPLEAFEKYRQRFPDIKDAKRQTFAAMTAAMDDAVGRVLAKLREHKLEEDTLIFFISDNGGPTAQTTSRNDPLRGYKTQMWEGGIRVPFLVQWKGHLPAGKTYEMPVSSLDIVPTALAAAGATIKPDWKLDGMNLAPFLTGKNAARPHETLCWRMGSKYAIRHGDWKMVFDQGCDSPELYNLAADISEKNNLAGKEPAKLKELTDLYRKWEGEMKPAAWVRQDNNRNRFDEFDKNHDGKLTPDEVPARVFEPMDANKDGMVTPEELRRYRRDRR